MSSASSKQLVAALRWGMSDADWAQLTRTIEPLRPAARTAKGRGRAADGGDPQACVEHWLHNPGTPLVSRPDAAALLAWVTLAGASDCPWAASVRSDLRERLDAWTDTFTDDPVMDLWWNVELPLLRGVLDHALGGDGLRRGDDIRQIHDQARSTEADHAASAALERSWPMWMDAEGVPHATVLDDIWLLLASWTRCFAHRERLSLDAWSDNLIEQFDRFVQQLCRLVRTDGAPLFPERNGSLPSPELLEAAFERVPHEETRATARLAGLLSSTPKGGGNSGGRGKSASRDPVEPPELPGLPLLPCYAEGTGLAVMRGDWTSAALQVAASFVHHQSSCSIVAGRQTWISGEWESRLAINGRPLSATAPWREVLWFSDDEVDYWEWELYLEDDWRVQRQLLLYRPAKWCLLADAILGEQPAHIDYHGSWQLAANAAFQPAADSHEGRLETRQGRAIVLPLALPEWRAEASSGTLAANDGRLTMRLQRDGQALYAPLFVMADPRLGRQPFTWRRLTVAESLKIVTLDMAAGYRVQFGRKQWTFYRALGAEANRTLLGQNVSSNFLACELQTDGLARPLVRIEASSGGRIGPDAAPRADHR
jgi:hypothetical protein